MKTQILSLIAVALATPLCLAQVTPGGPQTNGLTPRTASIDVNPGQNNGATESTGVGIAANGNVIIGWEDDSTTEDDIFFRGAVWTLYSTNLSLLISNTTITNYTGSQSMVNYYRAFFRTNSTPTPGNTAWGPKIKANRFGNGIGFGATAFALGFEIPTLAAINLDAGGGGDFPAVQLLNNNGTPAGIVTGVADADAEPSGDIRIADFEYLANGNIVIVGESRQTTDRALTGQTAGNVAVYRIVTPAGAQVKGYTAVSAEPVGSDIWHGVGVTANGFAVRFNQANITRVRMFDNAGNPTTTNLSLTNLTGQASAAAGGRGDGTGFHGNGTDAYVYTTTGGGTPWLTVLNADGTLRWSRRVVDASVTNPPASDRVDAAIAPDGRVIAVWDDNRVWAAGATNRLPQGRLFGPSGAPLGNVFWISERDQAGTGPAVTVNCQRPRIAWRDTSVAIIWESLNSAASFNRVVSARLFTVANPPTVAIRDNGATITLNWTGGGPAWSVTRRTNITGIATALATNLTTNTFTVPKTGAEAYYQISSP